MQASVFYSFFNLHQNILFVWNNNLFEDASSYANTALM